MNVVMMAALKKSMNKLPTGGRMKKATGEGSKRPVSASMLAIALGVAPMPNPQWPPAMTAAVWSLPMTLKVIK